jgi:hypothetical protein
MGKAAKFKRLRKLAAQLPQVNTRKTVVSGFQKGIDLLEKGIEEVEGKPVNPIGFYKKTQTISVPVNHHKKMKQFYNKYGSEGVKGYIAAVINIHEKQKL